MSSSPCPDSRAASTKSSRWDRSSHTTACRRFPVGICEESTTWLMSSSRTLILVALQDGGNRSGEMLPLFFVFPGRFLSLRCERVILAYPAVFGRAPFGLEMPLLLRLMQSWVQSALFEFKSIRTSAGGLLENFIAVHLAAGEQIQQQQTYASLEELPFDAHRVFIPCLTSLALQDIIHPDSMSMR